MRLYQLMHQLIAVSLAVLLFFCLEVVLQREPSVQAAVECRIPYTVQLGDTLTGIAKRFAVSYPDLLALNRGRIRNPDYILTGQILCLPTAAVAGTNASLPGSKLVLEVLYQYTPTEAEKTITLARGGLLGKRVVYPLQVMEPVTAISQTEEIATAFQETPPPVLVGVRKSDGTSPTYTLLAINRPAILASLGVSETIPITENSQGLAARPIKDLLGTPEVQSMALTVYLEEEGGVRFPFFVDTVDALPTFTDFQGSYMGVGRNDRLAFALFPTSSGEYRLVIRLSGSGFGPPNVGRRLRCDAWRRSGWWFRFLRSYYGC